MGGCSSKPQTAECEGHTPSNQELNLHLSGLKGIDPSDPSPYKGSQHTLQSLFVQHHRDGDEVLENAQTLQELLQDPKASPNLENESAAKSEAELASKDLQHELGSSCTHSSPTSVLPDPAQQDETETLAANLQSFASKAAANQTEDRAISVSTLAEQYADSHASSDAAESRFHGTLSKPSADPLPSSDPNLSRSISTDQVLQEIRASEAMEVAIPFVQAAEAQDPTRSGRITADCKVLGIDEEHAMEIPKEIKVDADMELEKAEITMGAYMPELQHEKATHSMEYETSKEHKEAMGTYEPALVPVDVTNAKSYSQGEKAVECSPSQETTEEGIEGKKEAERVTDGEKTRVQVMEHIESGKAGLLNEENVKSGSDQMQFTEVKVELGTGQECQKEQDCTQESVSRFSDVSGKKESTSFEKTASVQHGDNVELEVGLQKNEKTGVQDERELFEQKGNKDHGQAEDEIVMLNVSPSHVTPEESCVEAAGSRLIEKTDSEEEKLALCGNAIGAAIDDTIVKGLESDEKTINGGEHIQKDDSTGYPVETVIADSMKNSRLVEHSDGLESLENQSSKLLVSDEVLVLERNEKFEHEHGTQNSSAEIELKVQDQVAPELSLLQDKKGDGALLQKSLRQDDAIESLKSSRVEPPVELDHGNGDAVDREAKLEESMEVDTLATKIVHTAVEAPCPMKASVDVIGPEAKEFGVVEDKTKAELGTTKPNDVQREEVEATQQSENLLDNTHVTRMTSTGSMCNVLEPKCQALNVVRDDDGDAPLPSSSASLHQ